MEEQNLGGNIRNDEMPLVSVCVVTYNHAAYIRDCLEGALKQETDFPYEICLGEDESSDGTREICEEYAKKYPDKIRLFLRSRKDVIYSHGYPTGRFNFLQTLKASRGKYIAICEGDDFWHNPHKLQKQVEFMESHPEYSLCNSDYDYLNQVHGYSIRSYWKSTGYHHDVEARLAPMILSGQYIVSTPTTMMRRDRVLSIFEAHPEDFDERYRLADSQLWFHLSQSGKVKYFDESMATYRHVANSATAKDSFTGRFDFIKNVYWHRRSFAEREGYTDILPIIDRNCLSQLTSLAVLTRKGAEAREYAEKLTSESLWPPGSGWLRLAAKYGGIFAELYIGMRRLLYWFDQRAGSLSGPLRILLSLFSRKLRA